MIYLFLKICLTYKKYFNQFATWQQVQQTTCASGYCHFIWKVTAVLHAHGVNPDLNLFNYENLYKSLILPHRFHRFPIAKHFASMGPGRTRDV